MDVGFQMYVIHGERTALASDLRELPENLEEKAKRWMGVAQVARGSTPIPKEGLDTRFIVGTLRQEYACAVNRLKRIGRNRGYDFGVVRATTIGKDGIVEVAMSYHFLTPPTGVAPIEQDLAKAWCIAGNLAFNRSFDGDGTVRDIPLAPSAPSTPATKYKKQA